MAGQGLQQMGMMAGLMSMFTATGGGKTMPHVNNERFRTSLSQPELGVTDLKQSSKNNKDSFGDTMTVCNNGNNKTNEEESVSETDKQATSFLHQVNCDSNCDNNDSTTSDNKVNKLGNVNIQTCLEGMEARLKEHITQEVNAAENRIMGRLEMMLSGFVLKSTSQIDLD